MELVGERYMSTLHCHYPHMLPCTTHHYQYFPKVSSTSFTSLYCPAPESMEAVKCVQQAWPRGVQVQGGQARAVQADMGQLLSCTTLYSAQYAEHNSEPPHLQHLVL